MKLIKKRKQQSIKLNVEALTIVTARLHSTGLHEQPGNTQVESVTGSHLSHAIAYLHDDTPPIYCLRAPIYSSWVSFSLKPFDIGPIVKGWRSIERKSLRIERSFSWYRNAILSYVDAIDIKLKPVICPAISHQPSAISHQPSAISHQPSAISHQPSAAQG